MKTYPKLLKINSNGKMEPVKYPLYIVLTRGIVAQELLLVIYLIDPSFD